MALNATADKTNPTRYSGLPTHPHPKTHATENCWTEEKEKLEEANKRKHKAEKAEKATEGSSERKRARIPIQRHPPKRANMLTDPGGVQDRRLEC